MSYSINARAATKDELREAITDKLDGVAKQQPVHEADLGLAGNTAESAVDLLDDLPDGDTHEYSVTVSGSLGWDHQADGEQPEKFTHVNLSINASILAKPTG